MVNSRTFSKVKPVGIQIVDDLSLFYYGVAPDALRGLSPGDRFAIVYSRGGSGTALWHAIEFEVAPTGYIERDSRPLTADERAHFEALLAEYRTNRLS